MKPGAYTYTIRICRGCQGQIQETYEYLHEDHTDKPELEVKVELSLTRKGVLVVTHLDPRTVEVDSE